MNERSDDTAPADDQSTSDPSADGVSVTDSSSSDSAADGTAPRPTIFLVLDSLRRDHVGAYADDVDYTEHLDRIAGESVVFEDAVAQAPWTLPSHASMFTGTYPWEHGATNAKAHLETDRRTLAERFADAGSHTGAVTPNIWLTPHKGTTDGFAEVENFLGVGSYGPLQRVYRAGSRWFERLDERLRRPIAATLNRAFDSLEIDTACRSAETIDAAIEFVEAHADEQCFLFVNLMEPHEPYDPPREYLECHGVEDLDGVPEDNADFFDGARDFEQLRRAYRASVDYADDLVGRFDRALTECGLDDAVLVVAGDHGQALGEPDVFGDDGARVDGIGRDDNGGEDGDENGYAEADAGDDPGDFGHQFTVREEVTAVPLLVRHPEESARREDRLVELRELYWLLPRLAGIDEFDDGPIDPVAREERRTAAGYGGYEFPGVFRRYIDGSELDRYYRKYRYYRTPEETLLACERRDGTVSYRRVDRETGERLPVEPEHRRRLDGLDDVEDHEQLDPDEQPAAVEQRLEDLGYL